MALQGTIDSFALADVMRLLGSSSKTGRLIVNGDRGSANLWFAAGQLVGGGSSTQPGDVEVAEVVFDILRFQSGSFIFEADSANPTPLEPESVGGVIERAEEALGEWAEIVRVVPSLDSWLTLTEELQYPEVVVDQACWTAIVTVGGGTTVRDLGGRLGLGELPSSRLVRALVGAGFVDVGEARPTVQPTAEALPEFLDLPSRHPHVVEGPAEHATVGDPFAPDLDSYGSHDEGVALPSLTIAGLTDDPFADDSFPDHDRHRTAGEPSWGDSFDALVEPEVPMPAPADTPDVARSMSMLSDRAAHALASVADNESMPTVLGADDAEASDPDEERARMLRFLGSV